MVYAEIIDGAVENIFDADHEFASLHYPNAVLVEGLSPVPGIGWMYQQGAFVPPQPPTPPSLPPTTVYSKFGFRSRFTLEELVACDNAAHNTSLSVEQKATLNTVMKSFDSAQEIDLTNPATIFGVNYLAQCGLIASGRAEVILTP